MHMSLAFPNFFLLQRVALSLQMPPSRALHENYGALGDLTCSKTKRPRQSSLASMRGERAGRQLVQHDARVFSTSVIGSRFRLFANLTTFKRKCRSRDPEPIPPPVASIAPG